MKTLNITLLLALLSASAMASEDHFYLGTNLLISHSTELDFDGAGSLEDHGGLGFSAYTGYSFSINPNFDLGVEIEYSHLGKAEFANDAISVDGDAFYINARPKFIEKGNNLYSALILGVGMMNGDIQVLDMSSSDNEITYQAGLELGYMYKNIDFSVGYKYQYIGFTGVDASIHGATVGVRYNFN